MSEDQTLLQPAKQLSAVVFNTGRDPSLPRKCKKCGETKPLDDFIKNRRWYAHTCRRCETLRYRAWSIKKKGYDYVYHRNWYLRKTHGMTNDQVLEMFRDQGEKCAICGERPTQKRNVHIDHDHARKTVRGILCCSCNRGLGLFRDRPEVLRAAAKYLESHLEVQNDANR